MSEVNSELVQKFLEKNRKRIEDAFKKIKEGVPENTTTLEEALKRKEND